MKTRWILLIALLTILPLRAEQRFPVTLKVIDASAGELTGDDKHRDENVICWMSDAIRTSGDWWCPMYYDAQRAPEGKLIKENERWTWQITVQAPAGNYEWNPYLKSSDWKEINKNITYWGEGNLKFSVSHSGNVSGTTEITLNRPSGKKRSVTLSFVDRTADRRSLGNLSANTAKGYFTSADQSMLFYNENLPVATGELESVLTIDPEQRYQPIDGFGAALTGSSAYLITQLAEEQRKALLQELFDPVVGIGISYLRITIGASDFSTADYTYCDTEGIDHFAVPEIDRRELIPLLKEITAINPDIKLMATPWSAPAWMKRNRSIKGGSLDDRYMADFAEYLVRFIRAYEAEGIVFDAITVQNEPDHEATNIPSMKMSWQQQSTFIREHLGPRFRAENIPVKILLLDHNWDLWEYPVNILNDRQTAQYVAGTAFHGYGGTVDQTAKVYEAHPDKAIYFTEQSGGGWGGGFSGDLIWFVRNVFIGMLNQNSRNALFWNLALDNADGPQNGGCTNCRGVVTIDGTRITRNVEYYILAQFCKFVQPGAYRVKLDRRSVPDHLETTAIANADGSYVVFVLNNGNSECSFTLRSGDRKINHTLPRKTIGTYILNFK